ncbi:putative transcriptional regulator, TetR family protein [Catellatospora sp. TT07R-123]|uniref:TetR/AcrR family transcriptional regulator n=1 Tax=Catellatospora sp. TT07R-123 TaxID=2733863 RepID=UPI001B1FE26B|nr:TetR family transcriptional regulator [Catellatospora sp. TT07R-123]GHJ44543.1 putative transcriptional regulator, TetR family protein [Catellatospora sp. TT07R-123]
MNLSRLRPAERDTTRAAIVAAARELAVTQGWSTVRMAQVAALAGVSRQTVYNEFGGRSGLADALAQAEVDAFTAGLREVLFGHGGQVRAAIAATVRFALTEARRNALVAAIRSPGGTDPLLAYLTTRAEVVLATAAVPLLEWVSAYDARLPPDRVAFAVDTVIRLVVSHVVLPLSPVEQTADGIADLVMLLLHA